jgi:5'-nucleotidase
MSRTSIQFLTSAAVAVLASAQPASPLTIVLTNDDGWDVPGIQALKAALAEEHTVILLAPLDQQSGSSAALNLESPAVLVTKVAENGNDLGFAVSTFERVI